MTLVTESTIAHIRVVNFTKSSQVHLTSFVKSHPRLQSRLAMILQGPEDLVSSLLVVGILPRFQISPKQYPENFSRLSAIVKAQKEANRIISQHRFETAMNRYAPNATDNDIIISAEVLVFCEKPVGRWIGPFVVYSVNGKMLALDTGNRTFMAFVDMVKLHNITASN